MAIGGNRGAEMAIAEALGVEERHVNRMSRKEIGWYLRMWVNFGCMGDGLGEVCRAIVLYVRPFC